MNIRVSRFHFEVLMLSLAVGLISGCTEDSPRPSAPALVSSSADKVVPLLTFIVHGDTHSGYDFRNPEVPVIHPAFVQAFTELDPDYIFHTGDVVDNLSPLGNPYTEAHALLWSSLVDDRFFVAAGNHDNPEKLLAYLPAQYTLNHTVVDDSARALFIILGVPRCWDQLHEQYQYLLTQLKDPQHHDLTHRFVFFHVAPYSHNSKVGACETVRPWGPMMEELGVDVVFSGHSHAYEHYRYGAGGPGHCWPSPGGMHFVVTGRSGGYEHEPDEDFDCFADSFCIKSIYTHNYVYAAISATDCISVAVRDAEGRILDFFLIED